MEATECDNCGVLTDSLFCSKACEEQAHKVRHVVTAAELRRLAAGSWADVNGWDIAELFTQLAPILEAQEKAALNPPCEDVVFTGIVKHVEERSDYGHTFSHWDIFQGDERLQTMLASLTDRVVQVTVRTLEGKSAGDSRND